MKPILALLSAAVALVSASAAPVVSRVTEVTVYPDRAVVTRTAVVEASAAGPLNVEVAGLPASLMDESLRASASGSVQATLQDVSVRLTHLEEAPSERIKALEDEIAGLERDKIQLEDRLAMLAQREAYLGQIAAATTTVPSEGQLRTTPDEWAKLIAFMDDQRGRVAKEREDLNVQVAQLQAKIDARRRTLEDLRGAGVRSAKEAVVRLDLAGPGKLELRLTYAMRGAAWTPSYEARLLAEKRTLALAYNGLVRNATGEDWDGVALTLSTARPALGGGAPSLAPWIVDVYQPRPLPVAAGKTFSSMLEEAADKREIEFGVGRAKSSVVTGGLADNPAAPEPIAAAAAVAQAEAGLTSATFRVALPVTLKSDGTLQKVPIASADLPATLRYETAPKMLEAAFLSAKAANATQYPLLAGPVNAFLGDSFVATSRLNTVMPGEELSLPFGADEGIQVKRRLVNRFTETAGLTSRTIRVTYEFAIELTNTKKTAERVDLREPLPVSRNEKIEVTLLTPSEGEIGTVAEPKAVMREEGGQLVWHLDLKAGEKRVVPLKFKIEYPTDLRVMGLE